MLLNGGNLAPGQPGLAFVVNNEGGAARVDWLPATIDLDADAALARAARIGQSAAIGRVAHRHACEDWLRGFLAGGPRLARECEQAAMVAGFHRRLLERARVALAIRSVRTGFGQGSCCHLSLPETDGGPSDGIDGGGATSIHASRLDAVAAGRPIAPMGAGRRPYSSLRDVSRKCGI
jgi:hypothetical protein